MSGFIDEEDRNQGTLLPERVEEYVSDENPVRVIDAFVGELDLAKLGFEGMEPKSTDRPGYHPATMLKIYLYGYLNRIQSSRRLEQEARRNHELMWPSAIVDRPWDLANLKQRPDVLEGIAIHRARVGAGKGDGCRWRGENGDLSIRGEEWVSRRITRMAGVA